MAWIILEGVDRCGKSTVAEHYEKQGYEVIHMCAPDKKYSDPEYVGPTYFDDTIELYGNKTGQDIVFDRSPYGELVWPKLYNRMPQIDDEQIMQLREFEAQNETQYILMHDPDVEAHWQRCVKDKEQLTRRQFDLASNLYIMMQNKFKFESKNLKDYKIPKSAKSPAKVAAEKNIEMLKKTTPEQKKLEVANAINKVLKTRIIKYKGDIYNSIENDMREFLNNKIHNLFNGSSSEKLSNEEIKVLKILAKKVLTNPDKR